MKLRIAIVAFMIGCFTLTGCNKESTEEVQNAVDIEIEENIEETSKDDKFDENVEEASEKPMEVTDVSDTEKDIYVYRDGLKIFGKIYLPEGDGPFPVLICSNPMGGAYTTSEDVAKKFVENGIAGVCFDFAGAVSPSKSEGSITEYSVLTEAADLEAIINGIMTLDYIDANNMFLWGHSMGGFVAAYVGCQNSNLIKGMVLVEPSFQFHDQAREAFPEGTEIPEVVKSPMYCGGIFFEDLLSFDIYDSMDQYKNDVLIIAGTEAPSIGKEAPEYLEKAIKTFPSAKIKSVEGANHQFAGDSRNEMKDIAVQFVKSILSGEDFEVTEEASDETAEPVDISEYENEMVSWYHGNLETILAERLGCELVESDDDYYGEEFSLCDGKVIIYDTANGTGFFISYEENVPGLTFYGVYPGMTEEEAIATLEANGQKDDGMGNYSADIEWYYIRYVANNGVIDSVECVKRVYREGLDF